MLFFPYVDHVFQKVLLSICFRKWNSPSWLLKVSHFIFSLRPNIYLHTAGMLYPPHWSLLIDILMFSKPCVFFALLFPVNRTILLRWNRTPRHIRASTMWLCQSNLTCISVILPNNTWIFISVVCFFFQQWGCWKMLERKEAFFHFIMFYIWI